jgi:hypothetical protein
MRPPAGMTLLDFRTRQVLADLGRVNLPRPIVDPWTVANAVKATPELRCASIAVILQGAVTDDTPVLALEGLWTRHRTIITAAAAPVRAALTVAFDHLRRRGKVGEICTPMAEELATCPADRIEAALIAIARQMTAVDLDHVARADYGCDTDRHRAALYALLADQRVSYPPDDRWYPAEVVELVSHVPGDPGHISCLAIVLLDALRTGDLHGNASFRLEQQFNAIARLPRIARDTFLAVFRHLYEVHPAWDPALAGGAVLPWVDLP